MELIRKKLKGKIKGNNLQDKIYRIKLTGKDDRK